MMLWTYGHAYLAQLAGMGIGMGMGMGTAVGVGLGVGQNCRVVVRNGMLR